jgi:hypothetical protein
MAITVTCKGCGNTAQVPDKAAGLKVRCKPCGAVIAVPRRAAERALVGAGVSGGGGSAFTAGQVESKPVKVCTACGVDVAGRKRTKDPAGNYYCQPCWDARVAAARAPSAAVSGAAGGGVADDGAEPIDFACAVCGTLGGPDDVYDDNGRYVCKSCWDVQAASPQAPAGPAPKAGGPPALPPDLLFCEKCGGSFPPTHLQTAADGAVVCHGCILFRNHPAPRPAAPRPAQTRAPTIAQPAPAFAPAPPGHAGKTGGSRGGTLLLRWGISFLILGVGSFVLPLVGLQFRVINAFGDAAPCAGGVFAVVGIALVVAGLAKR